jgi:uncharacterized membrane protein YeaQ/YmgE (transglycosylase-associated protein family)
MPVLLTLSLSWLFLGMLIGLLAYAAKWRPTRQDRHSWLILSIVGALTALLAGWLGVLLLGKFFATPTALWVTVLAVLLLPRIPPPYRGRFIATHR